MVGAGAGVVAVVVGAGAGVVVETDETGKIVVAIVVVNVGCLQ